MKMNKSVLIGLVVLVGVYCSSVNAFESLVECYGEVGMFCGDCKSLAVCSAGDQYASFVDCPMYCNNGQCSSTKDTTDITCTEIDLGVDETAKSQCTGIGYFPNPKNCSEYVYCKDPALNEAPDQYKCLPTEMFDSYNYKCKPKVYLTNCVILKCTKALVFIPYSPNPAYFGFCKTLDEIIMYRCPDGTSFDTSVGGCVTPS